MGALRVPLLVPRLGMRAAELLEMPLMLMVVIIAARFVVRQFDLFPSYWACAWVGLSALTLVIGAELSLAVAIQDQTLADYIAGRDPVSGSVYIVLLCVFAAMPLLVARTKGLRLPSSRAHT